MTTNSFENLFDLYADPSIASQSNPAGYPQAPVATPPNCEVADQTDFRQELESLLSRVESATTHYGVLGLESEASNEQIRIAFQHSRALLRRAASAVDLRLPDKLRCRVGASFGRISSAFTVLGNSAKRMEYDHVQKPTSDRTPSQTDAPQTMNADSGPLVSGQRFDSLTLDDLAADNRRQSKRFKTSLPVHVIGFTTKDEDWYEQVETVDISLQGARIRLGRRVKKGTVLYLSLPMPEELRRHGHREPNYRVYAHVRRIEPLKEGSRIIGLEFIGENPPEGYDKKPWAVFHLNEKWSGVERRRKPREERSDVIWVEYFDESLEWVSQEMGRTENISDDGMRVSVKRPPADFEMVRISLTNRSFESFAVVCNRFTGADGLDRLCLRFLDDKWLLDLAQQESFSESEHTWIPSRRKKVLVADDDSPLRRVLYKILTQAGYEVVIAQDGLEAVEKARVEKPDLVLTDALMPRMHGFVVSKAVKELSPPPKVILLTAVYTKTSYKWEAKSKYGADDLVTKPFEVADLLARIEKHLAD